MTVPVLQPAFTTGEVSPSLFGRFDLARLHTAAATMRNLFVSYRGGAYSRAGTKFVGFSKQTGRAYPPRLITFQFSINQGLALEFGHHYMRVVSAGAFVTENPIAITGVTQANPAVITAAAIGAATATFDAAHSAILSSYAPADTITLAGGAYSVPASLAVTNTYLAAVQPNSPGTAGYVPGDTVNLTGGTQTTPAVLTVATTQVVSAAVAAGGAGGANGTQAVTGTTGTGTKFQASVTVAGGAITAVLSITVPGNYTVNPAAIATEPVTGAGLAGAQLSVKMGVGTIAIFNGGVFTANPTGGTFTQASSSGAGVGATFQYALMGPHAATVATPGIYSAFPPNPVSQASSSGSGLGAEWTMTTTGVASFANGDWVYIAGVGGMIPLNGQTYVVAGATMTTFQLNDVYGNPVDSTAFPAYTAGGAVARIYTLATPYAEADLSYLKFTESADVMSVACVNQATLTEYQPQDLTRTAAANWSLMPVVPAPAVAPPATASASASAGGTVDYQYQVTAVSPDDGTESIASPIASVSGAVNITATAGTITVTWGAVTGVNRYNVYKATPGFNAAPPVGALFGFAGAAYGTQFLDSNIVADFTQVPPTHQNPFAQGQVIGATAIAGGSGYSQTGFAYTINTATGSGARLTGIVVNGALVGWIVNDAGQNYKTGDTITVTGDGSGATATLQVGAANGTYPSVVAYFQQRRAYANTLNNPDTYFMSQPGSFTNFDARSPTIDSDAIIGAPWSIQVNGIQFMVPMPGGLVVLTGLSAWQLTGAGGSALNPQPIGPATQQAQPQAYNGCSATVPPVKIDYDILYVQAKGSIVRDLSYQFYTNIYTGTDLTLNSSHLFSGYTVREWAWCEEPYKLMWAVRNDGVLLSLAYLKPQEVASWSRHDTNGLVQSVCAVTEPPVDALYLAVQRFPGANTAYMIERMDNRLWSDVDDCWCVDCGLALPQPAPNATLTASSATGLGSITGVTALVGGQNYSGGTFAIVVDQNGQGPGAGAVPALTIVGGVITAISFAGHQGARYVSPAIVFSDPANTGSGASAVAILSNAATFTTSAPVFSIGNVGSVIRMGDGSATITAYTDPTHVTANITSPIIATIPNSGGVPQPATAGNWTMTAPDAIIAGLNHLIGATVTGVADGAVIPPTVVSAAGTIVLPQPASSVVVGLGFQAQLQSVYLDAGEPTVQGQRKKIAAATARIEASRGLKIGSNQPDGSTLSPPQIAPAWSGLTAVPDKGVSPYGSGVVPLYTGDLRIVVSGGYATPGQVAIQQDNPLPMNVLALVPELYPGDLPQTQAPKRQERGRRVA